MSLDKQVIYTAAHSQQAHLLRQFLEDNGIVAEVWNESLQGALGDLPLVDSVAPSVVVSKSVAKVARELAMEWESDFGNKFEDEAENRRVIDAWPTCPQCDQPRNAQCPYCHVAGEDFGDAYLPEDFGVEQMSLTEQLRVCLVCDEPTVPKFFKLCVSCGHDFGSGIEFKPPPPPEEVSGRTAAVVWILFGLGLLLIGYFWLVLR